MTSPLFSDVVVRGRLAYLFGAGVILALTSIYATFMSPQTTLALSAMLSAYLGLGVPLFLLGQREIAQLPVSRLELWRIRVIAAITFPFAVGLPMKLVAIALRSQPGWPTPASAMLSSLIDALYCLSLMGLAAVWPVDIVPYDPKHRRLGLAGMAAFLLLFTLPLVFKSALPLSWNAIGPGAAFFMTVLALLAAPALLYRPRAMARPSRQRLPSGIKKKASPAWPGGGLTGLSRLFWVHARQIALLAPCAFTMVWFVESFTEGVRPGSIRDVLHGLQLMPFDADYAFTGKHGFNVLLFIVVGIGDMPRALMQRVRAMRVLPMTATRLSLVFAGLAAAEATVIWLWLLGIHIAITGGLPPTLRLDIFLIFCGALACTRAFESLFLSSFAGRIVGVVTFMTPVLIATMMIKSPQIGMVVVGFLTLAGGIVLQAQLLRRRHKLYKFKPPTLFGRELPS